MAVELAVDVDVGTTADVEVETAVETEVEVAAIGDVTPPASLRSASRWGPMGR